MGCDIHSWVEIKKDDKWIAFKEVDETRNYERFAALASVRGISDNVPLGLPSDISDTVKYWSDYWGLDGHSHSYMSIKKAAEIYLATAGHVNGYEKKYPASAFFNFEEQHAKLEARLVFWFDC